MNPLGFALLAAALLAPLAQEPDGIREDFPAGDGERIGLFIGINRYPLMKDRDLKGCVNDAKLLRELLARRFGFDRTALLTDGKATRAGIGDMLHRLVEVTRATHARTGRTVEVVLSYSGHGSYVTDQATPEKGKDELDGGRDSTWVASDSTFPGGKNDVRDDDIHAALSEISKAGGRVLFISDSCHSGTVNRTAEFALARNVPRNGEVEGPADNLFVNGPAAAVAEGIEIPVNVAAITACTDGQSAMECVDAAGASSGRLSWILRRLLASVDPRTTNEEIFRRVVNGFSTRGFPMTGNTGQAPQFHAAEALRTAPILGGVGRKEPLYDKISAVFADFTVHAAPSLSKEALATISQWGKDKRILLAETGWSVEVHPRGSGFAVFPAESLPDAEAQGGVPMRTCADLDDLADKLLELALAHRLRSLDPADGKLKIRLIVFREGNAGYDRIETEERQSIAQLRDGDKFAVAVKNLGTEPVHVSFFDVDLATHESGKPRIGLLRPGVKHEDRTLAAGEEFEFFTEKPWKVRSKDHAGRHQVKAVATNVKIDFEPMVKREPAVRGPDGSDPIEYMKFQAATRDAASAPKTLTWAADSLVLEVGTGK